MIRPHHLATNLTIGDSTYLSILKMFYLYLYHIIAVTGLSVETVNSTSVNINWSSNNFVDNFSILYFASISGLKETINVSRKILNERFSVVVNQLCPQMLYIFYITCYSSFEGYSLANECGTIVYSIESCKCIRINTLFFVYVTLLNNC